MNGILKIAIPLTPKTQQRARVGKFGGYKTKSQKLTEGKLIYHLEKYRQSPLLCGNIFLYVECYFPRPKKHFHKENKIDVLRMEAPEFYTNTPDGDNILKQICDCGNEIIWKDDSNICEMNIKKLYCGKTEPMMLLNIGEFD